MWVGRRADATPAPVARAVANLPAGGLKAAGIILIYFVPFLLGFWSIAIDDWSGVRDHAVELVAFGVAILLLLPICLPLIPPLYWYLFDWIELSGVEMVVIGLLFWGTTFVMPAAFLQVSLRGRFAAALRVDRVVMFVGRNLHTYLEAWAISVIATAARWLLDRPPRGRSSGPISSSSMRSTRRCSDRTRPRFADGLEPVISMRDADHPRHAEAVGHHAEAWRPKGLGQRHLHLPAFGKGREQRIGLRCVGRRDGQ